MAEDELDGFENLDDLFGDDVGGDDAAVSDGIDDLLGDEGGGGGEGGGTSDSELDSFFEDLSTIDDLEMTQEEADEEPEPAAAAAAPAAAAAVAAATEDKPKKEKKPRVRKERPLLRRFVMAVIFLGLPIGAVYWFWDDVRPYILPDDGAPWEVAEVTDFVEDVVEDISEVILEEIAEIQDAPPPAPPPPPPPEIADQPVPPPAPPPGPVEALPAKPVKAAPAPRQTGPYAIQVATCFFDSCVKAYRGRLSAQNLTVLVQKKTRVREVLEVYSKTAYEDRDDAQLFVDRINREHRMEGQAWIFGSLGDYRISMGNFTDLARAKVVKETLNRRMQGLVVFTTRIRKIPYKLKHVVGGGFPSEHAALVARDKLIKADPRLRDAFVVRK